MSGLTAVNPQIAVCATCGSTNVTNDGILEWDVETQEWVKRAELQNADCEDCGGETNIEMVDYDPEKHGDQVTIALLRDGVVVCSRTCGNTDALRMQAAISLMEWAGGLGPSDVVTQQAD